MPDSLDASIRGLNACDGCEGNAPQTPLLVENRAGLSQIAQRIGTHGRFLQSMLARLSSARYPALRSLNTRDPADLTIALLDACAAVDDGLTFYTERYANEWYVRTASERVSLVQLARLIGYEPRPGVAANTYLAFTIESTPGTPETTTIEAGTRVMSIPVKDELPQFFETSAVLTGQANWNAMRVRTSAPQQINTSMSLAVVQGLESGIRRGDSVLIVVSDSETAVKRVQRVAHDAATNTTRLELTSAPTPSAFSGGLLSGGLVTNYLPLTDSSFGTVFGGKVYSGSDVTIMSQILGWSSYEIATAANIPPPPPPPAVTGVYALRSRTAIFGHNAPNWDTLPQTVANQDHQITGRVLQNSDIDPDDWQYPDDWDDLRLDDTPGIANTIDLDNVYPAITEDSWIVLESPESAARAYRVAKNQELTRNDYALSVKVTRLQLTSNDQLGDYKMRTTTLYGQSEQLPLAMVPISDAVTGDRLVLDQYYPGLIKGQLVLISGERLDLNGVPGSEVQELADALVDGTLEAGRLFSVLVLKQPLNAIYKPESVRINANVVATTHGESKAEVLGGGDGVTRYQTFALKQGPLTYTSAATPTGTQSSLEVRVNDVRWDEVPSLYGRAPNEPVFVVRHEDSGQTRVQFNAPIPTGQENVRATYRIGIGLAGMLRANQLSMLAVRPLGVRSVTNPLAPSGAEDRELIEDVRENSPLTVLTLDRLVSLQDYQNFARAFAGFSKALATPTADGAHRGVFVTVAGETGQVSETSTEFTNLISAMKQSGDPFVDLLVKPYRPAFFQIEASIGVDPAYLQEDVVAAVRSSLAERFSFTARQFGQAVTAVEVIATMQTVPGVVFVNLLALFRSDPLGPAVPATLASVLTAGLPAANSSRFTAEAAELLTLDPRPVQISTVTA